MVGMIGLRRRLARQVAWAFAWIVLTCAALMLAVGKATAQSIALAENHPADIGELETIGPAASYRRLDLKVILALRNQAELTTLLADQQDPASQQYHRWLTPTEFAARFGPTEADLKAVADWLASEGFHVTSWSLNRRYLRFSGTVAQAERLFGVTIVSTQDDRFYGNLQDPMVPAGFAGLIAHIEGLDNLRRFVPLIRRSREHRTHVAIVSQASPLEPAAFVANSFLRQSHFGGAVPEVMVDGYAPAFGPSDFYTFYDETPLLNQGVNGGNGSDCVAVVEDSNYKQAAVNLFDTTFALPAAVITNSFPTTNPGINSDEGETLMDIEYAHASAPNAPLRAYIGNDSNSIIDPLTDGIQAAVDDNACSVISVSFSECGAAKSFYTGTLDPILSQAASQGQSVFVAAGDEGAAGLVLDPSGQACVPASSRHVNEMAADPNVTGVGGTQFTPNFDANGDDVGFVSEQAWNDAGGATGGGASTIFAKPSWQKGVTPKDGHRDVPDVAMIASPELPGVFLGDDSSDPGSGCPSGQACINCCDGGTSLSAPLWAGITRLFAQVQGGRLGNINPWLYQLGASGQSAGLRDVIGGNNNFNGVTGFTAGPGYDQCTGWGTADVALLAQNFPTLTPTSTPTSTPTPTATPTPAGTLSLSSKTVTFPLTGIDTTSTASFSITNTGLGSLIGNIDASALGPPAALSAATSTTIDLPAGHSQKVAIQFAPTLPGAYTGSLKIASNDPKHSPSTVTVTGKAVSGMLSGPKTLAFGTLRANAKKTLALTIKNVGLGVLHGNVDTGGLAPPFTALSGSGSFQLNNGKSWSISVEFRPTAKASFSGAISITSDGGNLTVGVTGTGM